MTIKFLVHVHTVRISVLLLDVTPHHKKYSCTHSRAQHDDIIKNDVIMLLIQYVCIQYTLTPARSVQHLAPALPPAVPVVRVTLRFWCSMGSRDCSVCSNLGRLMSSPPPSPLPSPPPPPPLWGVLLPPQPPPPLAIFSGVIGGSLH